jgi:hypothetical protein
MEFRQLDGKVPQGTAGELGKVGGMQKSRQSFSILKLRYLVAGE